MTITNARKVLDDLSNLGWKFKPIPSFDGQELYLAYKNDNPLTSYPVEITGIKPSILFNEKLLA